MPTKAIDWGKIHLYWVDERCVPPDDPESNFGMTRKHLLDQVPLPTENIHRIAGELEPSEAANQYEEMLKNTLGAAPVFDLLMLGMGNDGHTASIFPHQIALWHSERLCVVATHPESGQMRVSLTGKVINNAASVAFLVAGEDKQDKIAAIFDRQKNFEQYPASLVKPSHGNLFWFLDREAAKRILH
jgi:6-phosphogluconolactonase